MVSPRKQDENLSEISITRRFSSGIDLIKQGKCPKGYTSPLSCMFCMEGHMLECHAGRTCEQAKCSHYLRDS
jgi:hypothetical protein